MLRPIIVARHDCTQKTHTSNHVRNGTARSSRQKRRIRRVFSFLTVRFRTRGPSDPITVCHLPPGTSKWNKIEHRLFCRITQNWRGKPLVSYQTIVQLIASTTTRTGLNVKCAIDPNTYPAGVKVSDEDMAAISLTPHTFHGEWNYSIAPRPS